MDLMLEERVIEIGAVNIDLAMVGKRATFKN